MAWVVDDAATVVARLFDEAERHDPDHRRTWWCWWTGTIISSI